MKVDLTRVPKQELTLGTGDIIVILTADGRARDSYLVTRDVGNGFVLTNLNGTSTYLEGNTLTELSQLVRAKIESFKHFPCSSYNLTFVPRD